MHSTMEKLDGNLVSLKIEVTAERLQKAIDSGFKRVAQQVNIPGFRKGKAPKHIIERFMGKEAALKEALDLIVPEAYSQAVKDNGITPIDRPEIDLEQIDEGQPLVFTAKVQVTPEVTLGQYKELKIEPKEYKVTEEDIENDLFNLRKRYAKVVDTDRDTVESGDLVTMDFTGKIEDEPFEGGTAEDFQLEIGSGTLIPGFEDQLIGAKIGEPTVVNVTFPDDYPNVELAGTAATFDVTVKTIKARELPELDEEFIKKFGAFETVDAFKEEHIKRLTDASENKAKSAFDDEVINTIVNDSSVEVPNVLVERRIDALIEDFKKQLSYQKRTLEDYFEATATDAAQLRESVRERAERDVKTDLVLDKITTVEKIEVTPEEIEARFAEMSQRFGVPEEKIRESFNTEEALDGLVERIAREKTVNSLIDGYEKAVKAD